jgi:predicted alpha/beta-hydrolase family hydrolase
MSDYTSVELSIEVGERVGRVSGLLLQPPEPRYLYVLAHGAGAAMRHRFMEAIAGALAGRGVATLRYQFPYTEAGRRSPDPPGVLQATVRAAVAAAAGHAPGLPLLAGGKSLGGRMTSSAAARGNLSGVRGLVFLGFPLHAPNRRGIERAEHLDAVQLPMLFLQGTRDALADLDLMRTVTTRLGPRATLHVVEGGDHSFGVLKRSGRSEAEVLAELGDTIVEWASVQVLR